MGRHPLVIYICYCWLNENDGLGWNMSFKCFMFFFMNCYFSFTWKRIDDTISQDNLERVGLFLLKHVKRQKYETKLVSSKHEITHLKNLINQRFSC